MHYTNLQEELDRMDGVVERRLRAYQAYNKGTEIENIVKIFLSSSKYKGKQIDITWLNQLYEAVSWAVENKKPINVSLAWACGTTAMSSYKFREVENNLPRLSDLWTIFWFKIFNRKVQYFHEPGISVVIIDEVPHGMILGRSESEIRMRQGIVASIAEKYTPFFKVIPLPYFDIENCQECLECPSDEEILAILMSIPVNIPSEVSDLCYEVRNKPWDMIKEKIGTDLWQRGIDLRMEMKKIDAQKKANCFSSSIFQGKPVVEACIVDKSRWSPDIWAMAFPQHGGTVLNTKGEGRFSIKCLPEIRLKKEDYQSIIISSSEFQRFSAEKVPSGNFTFYWVEK